MELWQKPFKEVTQLAVQQEKLCQPAKVYSRRYLKVQSNALWPQACQYLHFQRVRSTLSGRLCLNLSGKNYQLRDSIHHNKHFNVSHNISHFFKLLTPFGTDFLSRILEENPEKRLNSAGLY